MRQELREMAQRLELVLIETRDRRWTITTITGGLISSGLTLAEVELVLRSDTPGIAGFARSDAADRLAWRW